MVVGREWCKLVYNYLYFYIDIVIFMCFTHYCLFSYDKKKESFTFKTTRKN